METLTILHTNDLHSHFENWPKITRFLRTTRERERAAGHSVLLLDDGDAMDRSHPLSEATDGQINIEMLNELQYDAVTIGNNEGIGNSHAVLSHLYDHANFPVALANLFEPDGTRPKFAHPVVHKVTPAGTRVAIIGFTAPFFLTYTPNGWRVKTVGDLLPDLLDDIAGTYDDLVMLSHLGIEADRYLAKHYPQINVIIGGHTHHLLKQGEMVGHTLITAAEKYGHYVGQITLELDDNHRVMASRAATYPVSEMPTEPDDQAIIDGYRDKGLAMLAAQPVARLPHAFAIDYRHDSPLRQLGLEALAAEGHTDVSLMNAGLFLHDLDAGVVTKATLHSLLPHPMHLMRVTLTGRDMWRLAMEGEKNRPFLRQFHMVGMSFRGKIFGDIGYAGLQVSPKRVVTWQDQSLEADATYTLTTLDHYLFIPFFPTIEIMGQNELLFPDFLRDAFGRYLAKRYPLD
ncbi:bifunctional metallophosphatase/5'-nucleotidase [Lacticaseibacillus saniviri]|uniref:5-nucleotidase 2,3-cyclic phosphodiesterase related esterase n=1 Tax=Lacticaseibacillus saniviri JCM 17471 = DSM 24301 TaxID=1293598 RepID=A0A0R2N0H6_9LACO|nr:bifunctional UDP-sugar hydrolase/5'-nucleotidase [Lacticaseibacillus saniviri]KRO17936.1 5-nucleotidase 2,3-cyclic phosphodiesterase related esterase [Lacticaseibacillus saniviri JCM 17471 = DSM 24301]MCG4281720.1 bifunctional metallophosphatase/5'-nucleotidase [Lacticaseibacillus saniviri]